MTSVSQFIRFGCFRDEDALVWYLSVSSTDSRRNKNTFFSFEMYLNVIFLRQDGKQDTVVVHFNVYYKRFGSPKSKSVNILHSWLFLCSSSCSNCCLIPLDNTKCRDPFMIWRLLLWNNTIKTHSSDQNDNNNNLILIGRQNLISIESKTTDWDIRSKIYTFWPAEEKTMKRSSLKWSLLSRNLWCDRKVSELCKTPSFVSFFLWIQYMLMIRRNVPIGSYGKLFLFPTFFFEFIRFLMSQKPQKLMQKAGFK